MPFYDELTKNIEKCKYPDPRGKVSHIVGDILALRSGIREEIPMRTLTDNLHVATFNIREFCAPKPLNGKRTPGTLYYLAEIISSFDIVAIQEIIGEDDQDFMQLMKILRHNYKYSMPPYDKSKGKFGERMAFIYDERKVILANEACEMNLPEDTKALFKRVPYVCGFQAGWFKFFLHTVHLTFAGGENDQRMMEIDALVQYFNKRQLRKYNTIILGDLNTPDLECEGLAKLTKAGFRVPEVFVGMEGSNVAKNRFFDHILYKEGTNKVHITKGGVFDYFKYVFTESKKDVYYDDYRMSLFPFKSCTQQQFAKEFKTWRTFQMSDHLPVWAEIRINYAEDFLHRLAGN